MLERHIMQAQARAMSADERELNRANQSCDNYGDLGLPPGMSSYAGNLPDFHGYIYGWSVPLLFANSEDRFSCIDAYIIDVLII